MDTLIIVLLFAAAGAAWWIWKFLLAPNQNSVSLGGYRWSIEDDHLTIGNLQDNNNQAVSIPLANVSCLWATGHHMVDQHRAASSYSTTSGSIGPAGLITGHTHTTHTEAMSWKEKGASFQVVSVYDIDQEHVNRTMLLTPNTEFGFEQANRRNAHDVILHAKIQARLSQGQARTLVRWLKRHGVQTTVDNRDKERRFQRAVTDIQNAFRERFGYQAGDLDYLVLNAQLDTVSYARLSADGKLLGHDARQDTTQENLLRFCYLEGMDFGKLHHRQGVLIRNSEQAGTMVVISRAMWEAIEPHYKATGRPVTYRRYDH